MRSTNTVITMSPTNRERRIAEGAVLRLPRVHSVIRTPHLVGGKSAQETKPDLLKFELNDAGNADRLIAACGRDLVYCPQMRKWLVWDDRRWQVDEVGHAHKLAKRAMLRYLEQAIETEDRATLKFARESLDERRINGAIASAQCELVITAAELDTNPWLLTCLNGTIDLQTGMLRRHRREDFITKLCHFNYREDSDCPVFKAFLDEIMGGMAGTPDGSERAHHLVDYLQKVLGYALTGCVTEKAVFCLFGTGNNGKSTLLEAVRHVMSEYSMQILIDTLMVKGQESNSSLSDLADLRGARFVTTSEAEEGHRLAEGKLKYLSQGMGEIKAMRKYENAIKFPATHKLFLDANHRPIVRGSDKAIWNRLKPIPFDVVIPDDRIDKTLLDKLKAEGEGILAWMVEGSRRWYLEGLGTVPEVTEAAADWKSSNDVLQGFIEERCVVGPNVRVKVSALWTEYQDWVAEHHERYSLSRQVFIDRLREMGFVQGRAKFCGFQHRCWDGIGIRLPGPDGEDDK